jgi:5-methylcytosine-specific restriction endonuclease McrA
MVIEIKYWWNPDGYQVKLFKDLNKNIAYKAFRKNSSYYVSKKYVRQFVLEKYNNCCNYCKSTFEIQIDHILSVKHCFENNLLRQCNRISNLQVLCSKCNLIKGSSNGTSSKK